jgi:hypothetical protein
LCVVEIQADLRGEGLFDSELLEKLAALVPPPRLNLVRYHGVLAPNSNARAQIVPGPKVQDETTDLQANDDTPTPAPAATAYGVVLRGMFVLHAS